jgi:hypothetical protein
LNYYRNGNKTSIHKLEDFVKIRNIDYKRSRKWNKTRKDSPPPKGSLVVLITIIEQRSQSSYWVDNIGVSTPLIDVSSRSSVLSMKKSRNTKSNQNTSAMSASASRRRSRVENDLKYSSWNMRSFDLLPHKGPIKVLQKISLASCNPKTYTIL